MACPFTFEWDGKVLRAGVILVTLRDGPSAYKRRSVAYRHVSRSRSPRVSTPGGRTLLVESSFRLRRIRPPYGLPNHPLRANTASLLNGNSRMCVQGSSSRTAGRLVGETGGSHLGYYPTSSNGPLRRSSTKPLPISSKRRSSAIHSKMGSRRRASPLSCH